MKMLKEEKELREYTLLGTDPLYKKEGSRLITALVRARVALPSVAELSKVLYDAAQKYQEGHEAEILGGYEIEDYMAEKALEFLGAYNEKRRR